MLNEALQDSAEVRNVCVWWQECMMESAKGKEEWKVPTP